MKATGETVTFSVSASADCKWPVSTGTSWIGIETSSGAGSARGAFLVRGNDGGARSGEVKVGGRAISVSQDAAERRCSLSVGPASFSIPIEGGSFVFKVSVESGCPWSVEAAPSWISLRLKGGTGPGEVGFFVEKNGGATRSDAIVVSGQGIKLSQAGITR